MTAINLTIFAILIALTAFFVATEFAMVKVRSTKIDQLVFEGKRGAASAKKVVSHLDEYLSACQLGITVTALGIGWVGESTFAVILEPIFDFLNVGESLSSVLVIAIAFMIATFMHVVIGELAPKTLAIQKAETITLLTAGPIILFYRILFPFIWFLNGSARLLVRAFGMKPASEHDAAHSEEELRILMSESYESGEINQNELTYMNNIFTFDERLAKEIMVPRTEMVTVSVDQGFDEIMDLIKSERFTRYPVIDGDKDHVVGFINVKELLTERLRQGKRTGGDFSLKAHINPIIRVVETAPIHDVLLKMQKLRTHIAILVDEYGGTSGIVSFEDILEEIVGEIRDEFDQDEVAPVRKLKDHHFIIDAKLLIEEANEVLGIEMENEDVDTIGGWFLSNTIESEAELESHGYVFKVHKKDGYHIQYLEVKKPESLVS
ncbi:hypothetical protein AF331_11305 [Rossellomorea marisflavi]|uniref:HlyC/CorC family transporter n=1 Tax=Rossellomorea marisflavi TaxID=189381 RepID=A0A0M0G4C8_9BACI|nr:hemolysin family protein [Rossellomorea marisflavi]KON84618.1 hypothetical protein AF331_11305 [Rossellomorea marisflavi]